MTAANNNATTLDRYSTQFLKTIDRNDPLGVYTFCPQIHDDVCAASENGGWFNACISEDCQGIVETSRNLKFKRSVHSSSVFSEQRSPMKRSTGLSDLKT